MKRVDPSKKPVLSWTLVVRNCASTLEACLKSLRERTPDAEIVIFDTLSDDAGIDVRLDRAEVLAGTKVPIPKGAEAHGILRRALEDAGWKVVFIRIADETCPFVVDGKPLPPEPCVWLRVRPKEDAPDDPARIGAAVADLLGLVRFAARRGRTTQEIAREYADVWREYAGPDHDWTRGMYAVDDMAAPRQAALEAATGRWIGWVDGDDVLPGAAEAERILRLNGRWHVGEEQGAKGAEVKASDGAKAADGTALPPTLEDILAYCFEDRTAGVVKCDYLYRWEGEGAAKHTAVTWQERERFVKNDGSHRWASEGHEFLVPTDFERGETEARIPLLFVHQKEHTQEDQKYSVQRHFDILSKKWEEGKRCGRDGLYLANFSVFLCPQEEKRYLDEAREVAQTKHDRMRTAVALGNWHAARGLYGEALEWFAQAQVAFPSVPDPFFALAEAAFKAEDWPRAVEAYRAALSRPAGGSASDLAPRTLALRCRAQIVEACWKLAEMQIRWNVHDQAEKTLGAAVQAAEEILARPGLLGKDAPEAFALATIARQKLKMHRTALELSGLHDWLVRNDETLKARAVLDVVPHALEDHPLVVKMEQWARPLAKHVTDPEAYTTFYNVGPVNDAEPTPEAWMIDPPLGRTRETIRWLRENRPEGTVLEIGPYDGISAIPILRALPEVRVVCVEAQETAARRLEARAEKFVPDGRARLTVLRGTFGGDITAFKELLAQAGCPLRYDAVLLFEVIEHVPRTDAALEQLRWLCRAAPAGRIFLSTPRGAYDRGEPMDMAKRDPRGHVRALTLHDVCTAMRKESLVPEHATTHSGNFGCGDTLYVRARPRHASRDCGHVGFYVPSALWDWNGSVLHGTGMGASESTIVFLAERLAKDGVRCEIFGPVPDGGEEVLNGVAYWQREKVRHLPAEAKLVVSRAPYAWRDLLKKHFPGRKQADALWLQDAVYPGYEREFDEHFRWIVPVSEWHRGAMTDRHGIPAEKQQAVLNWIHEDEYVSQPAPERIPHRFVYASSPDRGLIQLLELWPRILEKLPDAQLHVFYGWEGCIKLAANNPGWEFGYRKMRMAWERLKWQKGVFERGRVPHAVLARELRMSDAWPYPCTTFEETNCAMALQARAAGCVPVCPPRAGLAETADCLQTWFVDENSPCFDELFVSALVAACETSPEARAEMSRRALADHTVEARLPLWKRILELP